MPELIDMGSLQLKFLRSKDDTAGSLDMFRMFVPPSGQRWTTSERQERRGTSAAIALVEAAGRPMAFAGEYVRCSTKGELENRIADGVRARLRP